MSLGAHPPSVLNQFLSVDFIQPRQLDIVPFHISDSAPKLLVLPPQRLEDDVRTWAGAQASQTCSPPSPKLG